MDTEIRAKKDTLQGHPIMRIDITGYVTERFSHYNFKVKITSDKVEPLSLSDIQVSKDVKVFIKPYNYPNDYHTEFKSTKEDRYLQEQVDKGFSFANALREGDQIECSVFIVDPATRAINRNPNDIETYPKFDLWLYPKKGYFRRSESDSRESLKFRKQWRYACINREKCGKITGYAYKYRRRRWINKPPAIIFPIIWWIQAKTAVSNLWKKKDRPKISNPITIISITVTTISIIVTLWALFFK